MVKNQMKLPRTLLSAAFAFTALLAAPVFAAPITTTFSGTVTYNQVNNSSIGQAVNGSLTLDASTFQSTGGNGTTYSYSEGNYYNPSYCNCGVLQSNPLQVSGSASDGVEAVTVGGSASYDQGYMEIARNDGGNYNGAYFSGYSYDNITGNESIIAISIYDFLGSATQIFTNINGGLDLTQGINWLAQGAYTSFTVYNYNNATGYSTYMVGTLNAVSTNSSVPEPASLALVGAALFGLAAIRRKRSQH